MNVRMLPLRNVLRHPLRSGAQALLVAFLAFAVFAGSSVVTSLRRGLQSLEARLGADIIVVPSSAASKTDLSTLFLQGTTGTYYMPSANVQKILAREGVENASPQLFLASLRASCCSLPVQVIGIDQETDFSVAPWIAQSFGRTLGLRDVVVGCKVNAEIGSSIRIYGENCPVVGRLASTGTGLDTAVYGSMDTLRLLLEAARGLGHDLKISGDPAELVSAIYVKVKDGADVQAVTDDINVNVRKVRAVRARSVLTDVSDSLAAVQGTIRLLILAIWVLALIILIIAVTLLSGERRREFAVLRLCGMTRRRLAGMALAENGLLSLAGGLLGLGVGAALTFLFGGMIESRLNLPYLSPAAGQVALLALATLALCLAVGMLSSAIAAFRLSRVDPGTALREG